eukprot:362989-Chlamydomonas_euryale.AAC.3
MRLSKSSPPRWVSPLVDSTSKTPSPTCAIYSGEEHVGACVTRPPKHVHVYISCVQLRWTFDVAHGLTNFAGRAYVHGRKRM